MSWAETMKASAALAAGDGAANDGDFIHSPQPPSWNPYEVWLTRVKQPGDRAAQRAISSVSNRTLDLPDQPAR